ncbi:DNA cytosine methyltransferase [Dactylosporangium sp. NPDC049140]|uniref:DNA cytosine methyltransferase n=1 Tax=Dactylosporangium sp. NPDC049140 TaxID=3155647 RepID=UPI003401FA29
MVADPDAEPVGNPPARLRVVDLFAGCGGLTEGFRQSGFFAPVAAVELNQFAAATYAANFGSDHIFCGDIGEWVKSDLPAADVVIGGPPCQGFSNLGKKRADDERNQLWREYVNALVKIKPKAFLIENVDRFAKSDEFAALQREAAPGGRLEDYELDPRMVTAADYGSAQVRKRFIVIGTHKSLPQQIMIPDPTVRREAWRTVKDALHGVTASIPVDHIDLPPNRLENGIPGPFLSSELHVTRYYDPKVSIARFKKIPPGGNRFDLPDDLKAPCWKNHLTGSADVMGRLRWDKPSVTIRTEFFKPEKGRYLHPEEHRALTHYEAALLQGFPDNFKWCGTKIQIARQIGNAVPVELAKALAEHIGASLIDAAEGSARARQPQQEQLPLLSVRAPRFE